MPDSVPEGWRRVRLGDVLDSALGGGTPARGNPAYWGGTIPWATVKDMRHSVLSQTEETITPAGVAASSTRIIPAGSVLIATRMAVGAVAWAACDTAINQDLKALIPTESLDARFLFQLMLARRPMFESAGTGTTVKGISIDFVRGLDLLLPSRPEQRAIAAVLDAVDEAIERTEEVIAATDELRRVLIHDLLTRGVPGWHSEWKHVPGLGTVPECWEATRLGDLCEVTSGFALGPARAPRDSPRPYLTVANVQTDRVSVENPRYMELTDAEYLSRSLRAGDLVVVEGHAQISQLGRAAIVPPEAEGYAFQNHLFRVRLRRPGRLGFVAAWINGSRGRSYFASFGGTTSGLNTVSARNVRLLPIPWPREDEQSEIVRALSAVSADVARAEEVLGHLTVLKATLADALLSGRLRLKDVADA